MTATTTCENSRCSHAIEREPGQPGRPRKYCSASCRSAAYRERVRLAEEAAARVARLVSARALAARALPLAERASGQLATQASVVFRSAADASAGRGELVGALAELDRLVTGLRHHAVQYRDAADEAATLAAFSVAVSAGGRR
jgi:hypothetical protein